jgi:WD40 repeat protein
VAFSRSGELLASGSQDEFITVLRTSGWSLLKRVHAHNVSWTVTSVDIDPEEKFCVYSTMNDTLHIVYEAAINCASVS